MKNFLKRLIMVSLIICLFASTSTFVMASTTIEEVSSDDAFLSEASKMFEDMTDEELNQYIDIVKNSNSNGRITGTDTIKLAWLAAAQIATNNGYPCAGKLVTCSVNNTSYSETPKVGPYPFTSKIKVSSNYKTYFSKVKSKTTSNGSFIFTKSDNADLFYALHKVDITTKGTSVGTSSAKYTVTITDKFDFGFDNDYSSLFTTTVNNWAWLCQQTGVLNKIPVTITFVQ